MNFLVGIGILILGLLTLRQVNSNRRKRGEMSLRIEAGIAVFLFSILCVLALELDFGFVPTFVSSFLGYSIGGLIQITMAEPKRNIVDDIDFRE